MASPYTGLYQGVVTNNRDPQQAARVKLLIPGVLGKSESAWAQPSAPTPFVPDAGDRVWVQFTAGALDQPVYSAVGFTQLASQTSGGDSEPPKPPTGLNLTTAATVALDGTVTASVTALWSPPTENQDGSPLTDLDHYEVQTSYDDSTWSGATVVVDDTLVVQNTRPGVNFWLRVVSVDTSGNRSTPATQTILTASSSTPPPQPSTPTATGVLGAVRVVWNGLDHTGAAMPSLFDHVVVQRSANGAFTDTVIAGVMRTADVVYDQGIGYTTNYTYRLLPVSRLGVNGTPSGTVQAQAVQALSQDIIDHAISTVKIDTAGLDGDVVLETGSIHAISGVIADIDADTITTGTLDAGIVAVINLIATNIISGVLDANLIDVINLTANDIQAGTLGVNILLSGSMSTSPQPGFGQVVTNPGGITLFDSSGNVEVQLPTDPALSASFNGNAQLNTVTVTGGMSVRGSNNEYAVGSQTVLRSGPTTNGASAQPIIDHVSAPPNGFTGATPPYSSGLTFDSNFYYVAGPVFSGTRHLTGVQIYRYDWSGNQQTVPLFAPDGVTTLGATGDPGGRADMNYPVQMTLLGGFWYVLFRDSSTDHIQIRKCNVSNGVQVAQFNLYLSTPEFSVALGNDGTFLLVADCNQNGWTRISKYTTAGAFSSALFSTHVLSSSLSSVIVGNFDLGSTHYIVSTNTGPGISHSAGDGSQFVAYTASGTTLTHDSDHDWNAAVDFSGYGLCWDSTNSCFVSFDGGFNLYRYTATFKSTSTGANWWASFAWRNSTHSYRTTEATPNPFTMVKRARLTINTPPIPSTGNASVDPDSVSIYLAASATAPARTAMWLQTDPGVGVTSYLVPSPPTFSGTNPRASSNFPTSTPAELVSDAERSNGNPLATFQGDGIVKSAGFQLGDPGTNQSEALVNYNKDSSDTKVWERHDTLLDSGAGLATFLVRDGSEVGRFHFTNDGTLRFTVGGVDYTIPLEIDPGGGSSSTHAALGIPYAVAANTVTASSGSLASGVNVSTAVTFPAGRFSQAPIVLVTLNSAVSGSNFLEGKANAITSSGFNLLVYNMGTSAAVFSNAVFGWVAYQMTPTSASG